MEVGKYVDSLHIDLGYGGVYSMIRENLQTTCKNHKLLIVNSIKSFSKVEGKFTRSNIPTFSPTFEDELKMY